MLQKGKDKKAVKSKKSSGKQMNKVNKQDEEDNKTQELSTFNETVIENKEQLVSNSKCCNTCISFTPYMDCYISYMRTLKSKLFYSSKFYYFMYCLYFFQYMYCNTFAPHVCTYTSMMIDIPRDVFKLIYIKTAYNFGT